MKNSEKDLLRHLVKKEISEGNDMKTAVTNITKSDGSNFTPQTIRNYYKAFSEDAGLAEWERELTVVRVMTVHTETRIVTVKSEVAKIAAKEVRKSLVALPQPDGSWTGYEWDTVGEREERQRFAYPNLGTDKQNRFLVRTDGTIKMPEVHMKQRGAFEVLSRTVDDQMRGLMAIE